jgi:glycosyltransferase involved in cell wall biosynthesis
MTGELYSVSAIIPTYNEKKSIQGTITRIRAVLESRGCQYEIIVVDDGSRDGSAELARAGGATVLCHPHNQGYGAALKTGIRHAKYDLVAITDADGTYPIEDLSNLLTAIGGADMVVGARIGQEVNIPAIRKPAKWFLRRLASYLTGVEIPDINSGLRVFRKDIAMEFIRLYPDRFSFTTTITLAMMTNGYVVLFVPINYHPREGRSKIRPIRDTISFLGLTVRTVLYFRPLKVFGPTASAILLVGVVRTFVHVVTALHVDTSDVLLLLGGLNILAVGLLADLIDKRM